MFIEAASKPVEARPGLRLTSGSGLQEQPRGGRPPTYTREQVGVVVQTALTDPQALDLEFASWTRTMGGPDDVKHAPLNADGVEVEVVYG